MFCKHVSYVKLKVTPQKLQWGVCLLLNISFFSLFPRLSYDNNIQAGYKGDLF